MHLLGQAFGIGPPNATHSGQLHHPQGCPRAPGPVRRCHVPQSANAIVPPASGFSLPESLHYCRVPVFSESPVSLVKQLAAGSQNQTSRMASGIRS